MIAVLSLVVGTGCAVNLKHGNLRSPSVVREGNLNVAPETEGIHGRVGWGRFTVFYIPIIPVHISGNGNRELAEQIKSAVRTAGYDTLAVAGTPGAQGPVLEANVGTFYFNNYTWLFPLVPTWGKIELQLALKSSDGKSHWSRNFVGRGFTLNFFNGYSIAANEAMQIILDDMVRELSSEYFARLVAELQPALELPAQPPGDPLL